MRVLIGLVIVGISIYFFGWWGLLSLIIALPFIGWTKRQDGPFPTSQNPGIVSDYKSASDIKMDAPMSFRLVQDILVKASKGNSSLEDLILLLNQLKDNLRIEQPDKDKLSDKDLLKNFLERFSFSFPNWQKEYLILNEIIDRNY